jgi:hypothetical protein
MGQEARRSMANGMAMAIMHGTKRKTLMCKALTSKVVKKRHFSSFFFKFFPLLYF